MDTNMNDKADHMANASSIKLPLIIALIGLIGTGVGAIIGGYFNIQLEREKLRSSLILKAIETDDPKSALDFLKFLKETSLVEGLEVTIETWENDPKTVPLRPSRDLDGGIFSENLSTRRKSLQTMIDEDLDKPEQIKLVLETLEIDHINTLTPQARVNALFFLNKTHINVWTNEMKMDGIRIIEEIDAHGIVLGPQALSELAKLKEKLSQS